jgi:hypothetical protein
MALDTLGRNALVDAGTTDNLSIHDQGIVNVIRGGLIRTFQGLLEGLIQIRQSTAHIGKPDRLTLAVHDALGGEIRHDGGGIHGGQPLTGASHQGIVTETRHDYDVDEVVTVATTTPDGAHLTGDQTRKGALATIGQGRSGQVKSGSVASHVNLSFSHDTQAGVCLKHKTKHPVQREN